MGKGQDLRDREAELKDAKKYVSQAIVEVFVKKFQTGSTEEVSYLRDFCFFDNLDEVSSLTPGKGEAPTLRHFHQAVLGFKFRAVGEESSEAYSSQAEFEISTTSGVDFFDPQARWLRKEADISLRLSTGHNVARFLALVETRTEYDHYLNENVTIVEKLQRFDMADLNLSA